MAMDLKKKEETICWVSLVGTRIKEVILFLLKFADNQRIWDLKIILVNKSFHRTLKSSHSSSTDIYKECWGSFSHNCTLI